VVSIRKADNQLQIVINDKLTLSLEHYHYDIFEANLERFDYRLKLSFATDLKGNIAQVAIQMEPMVKDIIFTRLPDRRLTKISFLKKFIGVYDYQKIQLTITLKNRKLLTASIPGEPDHVLLPYQGTEFTLQGLSGYSIEFKQDNTGEFAQAIIIQPGMVFTANKHQ
jgi:hypothetical protein